MLLEKRRGLLDEFAALPEGQGAQGRAAFRTGEGEGLLSIETVRGGVGENVLGRGIEQGFSVSFAFLPAAAQIALQFRHGSRKP